MRATYMQCLSWSPHLPHDHMVHSYFYKCLGVKEVDFSGLYPTNAPAEDRG